jgi:hypothetical protein
MAKPGKKRKHPNTVRCVNATIAPERNTVSSLREDENLWYKVRVLIYDLRNMDKDHASEQRTLCTTDELYISAPYFIPAEASRIKKAIIERTARSSSLNADEGQPRDDVSSISALIEPGHVGGTETIEGEIKTRLVTFFEKRRASGDSTLRAARFGPDLHGGLWRRASRDQGRAVLKQAEKIRIGVLSNNNHTILQLA